MASDQLKLSIVVPVYGSAAILPKLVNEIEENVSEAFGTDYELLLIHDRGPDESWKIIVELASHHTWVKGIDLRKNAGQHNAVMAGLNYARGRFIVTMDDDLQHSPADVPRIVEVLQREDCDLCYVQFVERKHALWKRLGSAFNDLVARHLLGKPKSLYLSPFRGMRSEIRDEVIRYRGPFVYVDGLLLQSTTSITTITGHHHSRQVGNSGYSLKKSIRLWLQMATSFSVAPLRMVSLAGFAASAAGFLFALLVLVQKLFEPELAVGWASLIIAVLIMGGMQLLALGAIGEYVGRVLMSLNNQPQYLVRATVNLGTATTATSHHA